MIEVITKRQCTGCQMCGDICPQKAISFEPDVKGFWYPKVDNEMCTKCGVCVKRCPALNEAEDKNSHNISVYAAWSSDKSIRVNSTSGGIFYEFANSVLLQGGYVAGVVYTNDFKGAEFLCTNDKKDLPRLQGSKYFQSDSTGLYKSIKTALESDIPVFFCGTPCQVAAVYAFLGKNYDKLVTCDFICLGINSPKAYRAYIEDLEKQYNSPVDEVHFKHKRNGWSNFGTYIRFKNGRQYYRGRNEDPFVIGYIESKLFIRENCLNCLYRKVPHQSDLTIGDFWGLPQDKRNPNYDDGTSVVIVNSEKGSDFFGTLNNRLAFYNEQISTVTPGNPALVKGPVSNPESENFFKRLDSESFIKLIFEYRPKHFRTTPVLWLKRRLRVVKYHVKKRLLSK